MNVVVDTNVFLGACLGQGPNARVVRACLEGRCVPLMGAALLSEMEDVLSRSELFSSCRLDPDEREELLDIFLASAQWTRIYFGWRPNLVDEGDNHLIELAVAGNAHYIITNNVKDFRKAELTFSELSVVKPQRFLQELGL